METILITASIICFILALIVLMIKKTTNIFFISEKDGYINVTYKGAEYSVQTEMFDKHREICIAIFFDQKNTPAANQEWLKMLPVITGSELEGLKVYYGIESSPTSGEVKMAYEELLK